MHLVLSILFFLQLSTPCGDGKLYAVGNQTEGDSRFSQFPKLEGKRNIPVYPGGDKALDKLIREKLILTKEAQQHTFVLNFYFVVNCNGSIGEVTVLGDEEVNEWTNIENLIQHTRDWQPATKNGQPVDCIYFRKINIIGKEYQRN